MACVKAMKADTNFKSNQREMFEDFYNLLGICAHPLVAENKSNAERATISDSESDDESHSEDPTHVCK